ncbi:MAG: hypothetical protein WC748_10815 [Legionellales bacterium]|jgi:hypothetical protein
MLDQKSNKTSYNNADSQSNKGKEKVQAPESAIEWEPILEIENPTGRVIIGSDVHGELRAFEEFLADAK